jgi:hypothetical protein
MIDKHTTEYLEKLRTVQLGTDAKLRMREELSSFADFHSVRIAENDRSIKQVQSYSVFTLFTHTKSRFMNATLLIALMIGTGGTAFAAQNTVPGDFLYPVKVHVNENVRSSLAVGADAEAKLQAEFFEERLDEARKLALSGKHEAATSAEVRTRIDAQREKTLAVAAQASAENESAIRKEVADSFNAAQRILVDSRLALGAESDTAVMVTPSARSMSMEAYNPATISSRADATTMATFDAKMEAQADVDMMQSARSIVDELFARIESIRASLAENMDLDAEVKTEIEADLDKASVWAEGSAVADAQVLIEYIENFLGLSFNGQTSTGELRADVDVEEGRTEPAVMPLPMPMDIDVRGGTNAGYGIDGNSGSGAMIDIAPSAGGSVQGSAGSSMIDMMIDTDFGAEGSAGL